MPTFEPEALQYDMSVFTVFDNDVPNNYPRHYAYEPCYWCGELFIYHPINKSIAWFRDVTPEASMLPCARNVARRLQGGGVYTTTYIYCDKYEPEFMIKEIAEDVEYDNQHSTL